MSDNQKLIEEAFKKYEAPTWGDAVARDAAIRWHMRGFNDALGTFEEANASTGVQYPQVDEFAERMRAELIANAHKGDAWQNMTVRQAWGEISWHVGKLTGAIKSGDAAAIRELTADIANGALMLDEIIAVNQRLAEIGLATGEPQ